MTAWRKARRERERPLPQRERLDPPPDFMPVTSRITEPMWHVEMRRTPCLNGPTGHAYLTIERQGQVDCGHSRLQADRFGEAVCVCGARLWSPWWVADGVFGLAAAVGLADLDGTSTWIADEDARRDRETLS